MTTAPTLDTATEELRCAKAALDELRAKAATGGRVTPQQLSNATSAIELAEIRVSNARDVKAEETERSRLARIDQIRQDIVAGGTAAQLSANVVDAHGRVSAAVNDLERCLREYATHRATVQRELSSLGPLPDDFDVDDKVYANGLKVAGITYPNLDRFGRPAKTSVAELVGWRLADRLKSLIDPASRPRPQPRVTLAYTDSQLGANGKRHQYTRTVPQSEVARWLLRGNLLTDDGQPLGGARRHIKVTSPDAGAYAGTVAVVAGPSADWLINNGYADPYTPPDQDEDDEHSTTTVV